MNKNSVAFGAQELSRAGRPVPKTASARHITAVPASGSHAALVGEFFHRFDRSVAFLRLIALQTRRRIVEADIAAVRVRFIGEIREESTFQPSFRTGQDEFTAVE